MAVGGPATAYDFDNSNKLKHKDEILLRYEKFRNYKKRVDIILLNNNLIEPIYISHSCVEFKTKYGTSIIVIEPSTYLNHNVLIVLLQSQIC